MGKDKDFSVIDLFSGVGGISLGAARAGFAVGGAVDNSSRILATHELNFPTTKHLLGDVSKISGKSLLRDFDFKSPTGIVGGPPCQGFSVIGRRQAGDLRNSLFHHFFRIVSEIKPDFFVAENVTGILAPQYRKLVESALAQVDRSYRVLSGHVVNAIDFGVPTDRKRVFFVGFRRSLGIDPSIVAKLEPKKATTVGEALRGLPRIRDDWQTEALGWRRVTYLDESTFTKKLRGEVPTGIGCQESLSRLRDKREVSGCLGTAHKPEVKTRFSKIRCGERDEVSKCYRLDHNGFCPTLRAGTGPELGSFQAVRPLHPVSDRVITPREAARLQGFPDWFRFDRTKWHSFRMIGNSVSPIVAEEILRRIKNEIT